MSGNDASESEVEWDDSPDVLESIRTAGTSSPASSVEWDDSPGVMEALGAVCTRSPESSVEWDDSPGMLEAIAAVESTSSESSVDWDDSPDVLDALAAVRDDGSSSTIQEVPSSVRNLESGVDRRITLRQQDDRRGDASESDMISASQFEALILDEEVDNDDESETSSFDSEAGLIAIQMGNEERLNE